MMTATQPTKKETNYVVDPKRFNLWLAIIGSMMFFAGITSAYIVRKAAGNWNSFPMPEQFIYSTVIVVLSSLTLHWAYLSAKKDELFQVKVALFTTLILGLAFGLSQYLGWKVLVNNNLHFTGDDVAVSFFYSITAFHALHLFGGWIAIVRTLRKAFRLEVHKKSMRAISLCTTYWHFMGVLWIYLYLFLFLNR